MSEQQPSDTARLDLFVQKQVQDALARRRARDEADAALRAGVLASDLERERTAGLLNEAFAQGRLTSEEHAERTTRTFLARTLGDLDAVLAGLEVPEGPTPARLGSKLLFWAVTVLTSPFLMMGAGLLLAGQDGGDRVCGLVLLALFAPGLYALQRRAWPERGRRRRPYGG